MKKTLTIVGSLAGVLVVAYLAAALLGPKHIHMERSVDINASKAVVFNNLSNYHNWMKWSPWAAIDPACKYEFFGTDGQVGAGYNWSGNDKVGEGSMTTTEMTANSMLAVHLTFKRPFQSEAGPTFKLEDGANGATKLTWTYDADIAFKMRPMMMVMNMEKMLGPDYEKGLASIKAICEHEGTVAPVAALEVKETAWEAKTYVTYRQKVAMKDLGKFFQEKVPATFMYANAQKMGVGEPISGLYYTWDTASGKTEVATAIVVKDASKASGEYKAVTLSKSKALVVDYYGPYEKIGPAHEAIHKYMADKGLKMKSPAIEEYITDPGTEKDWSKVLTKVYYLID